MKLFSNKISKYQIKRFSTTTHEVFNQASLLRDFNLFESDPALKRGLEVFGGYSNDSSTFSMLNSYGKLCGEGSVMDMADTAERNKPILKQFDIQGNRVDTIDFNPSYHSLMKQGIEVGASSYGFNNHDRGSQVARAGLIYMENQLEPGHCCPIVMSHAAIPVLRRSEAFSEWNKKLHTQKYDERNVPIQEKAGITVGMSMTGI
jgi:putative acyl-CoA dehydrogenase